MYWSVLMLTSTFTLATKSIEKWSKISAFIMADFISVFITEFVNMWSIAVAVYLVTRVDLLIAGTIH